MKQVDLFINGKLYASGPLADLAMVAQRVSRPGDKLSFVEWPAVRVEDTNLGMLSARDARNSGTREAK
jgi:hypothetical protein